MQFNAKFALLAVLAASAMLVAAEDTPANNGTVADTPATNGTVADTPSNNGTVADTPANNGTVADTPSNNGTVSDTPGTNSTTPATNGTSSAPETPQPSGGTSTRRALQDCQYACPSDDQASEALKSSTDSADGEYFVCAYASGACTYQMATGVLNADLNNGECRSGAVPLIAGCTPGDANNGGVLKTRARRHRRSSREIQYEALARRLML